MKIEKALTLEIGNMIQFPADRGEGAGIGKITHISKDINKSFSGKEYIWVTVKYNDKNQSGVWPSNRIETL